MTSKLIEKYLKREMREMKKRKKECAKLYPDWQDDEFNMFECKSLWGLPSRDNEKGCPSFSTYNKAAVYYNRDNKRYYMSLDDGFFDLTNQESREAYIKYLLEIKDAFATYVFSFDEDKKIPFEPICISELMDYGLEGKSLAELYCKFCVLIKGIVEYFK